MHTFRAINGRAVPNGLHDILAANQANKLIETTEYWAGVAQNVDDQPVDSYWGSPRVSAELSSSELRHYASGHGKNYLPSHHKSSRHRLRRKDSGWFSVQGNGYLEADPSGLIRLTSSPDHSTTYLSYDQEKNQIQIRFGSFPSYL